MENSIYHSIATRTGGDIYIGVVGPVRTGKSTFIKGFMEHTVLPNIDNVYARERARDELPQSGSGRTIMTAEPKFVPEEAVRVALPGGAAFNVRMIDCVGYMVDGAVGQLEGDEPRMVSTPWFDYDIPLGQAAETGTRKVITEHSTIGLVVTADGSFGEIPREAYESAEERIIAELRDIRKPYCILVNSARPASDETQGLVQALRERHGVAVLAIDCARLSGEGIDGILSAVLYEFPAREFCFTLPEWVGTLPAGNDIRDGVYAHILAACEGVCKMRDAQSAVQSLTGCEQITRASLDEIDLGLGQIKATVTVPQALFFSLLSEQSGVTVRNEGDLLPLLSQIAGIRSEYDRLAGALQQVRQVGYGIVMPTLQELRLEEPEIIRSGGQYGVKLRASAPSIHMIRADIETEISPIVGSEKQSEDMVHYLLSEFEDDPEKIWNSNIFGKSLSELVGEGLNNKLYKMPEDARAKLQETLQRIINEGSGGLICIIL